MRLPAAESKGLSHTKTLLDALDDATSLNLGSWWGSRFPTLY